VLLSDDDDDDEDADDDEPDIGVTGFDFCIFEMLLLAIREDVAYFDSSNLESFALSLFP
jgi:hypothetical protein